MNWERRMIKEFRNCIDDSSNGGFGRDEGTCPSNVPDRDARDDNSDDSDDGDDEEDLEEDPDDESDGDKTQKKGVVHEG